MSDFHGRFVWYELITTDVAAARTFYAKVVGWGTKDAVTRGRRHTVFTASSALVGGLTGFAEQVRKTDARPMWLGYVGVDDVDATVEQVTRLGGAVRVPPTNVLDISRFSIVTDPQMAMLAVIQWLRPSQHPLAAAGERRRVGWHELLAADCDAAFSFYGELFNWRKAQTDGGSSASHDLFSVGGQIAGGMIAKSPSLRIPHWLYYFNVDDIDVASGRVKSAGGGVIDRPGEVAGGNWIARCVDPQGAAFALVGGRCHGSPVGYFARA